MAVKATRKPVFRRFFWPVLISVFAIAGAGACADGQARAPSSTTNPYFGSVTAHPASNETLKLSLDDAVRRGLENNLGLREAESGETLFQGEENEALQEFLPTIILSGGTGVFQRNLAALGFGSGTLKEFGGMFPGGAPAGFSLITKYDLTQGQVSLNQTLFSGPVIAGWKAAGAARRSAYFAKMSARGEVVQQVAAAYLGAIAAASEVDNAKALEQQDRVLWQNAQAAHQAGTAANLDEVRARVQLQTQQQVIIEAQNALDKSLILLKREIGIDPGQKIVLTDPAPYSDLASQTPAEVRAIAYKNRQDYQYLQNQVVEQRAIYAAYRSQRWPSLSFNGFYGVNKVNGSPSHGVFAAQGTLNVPIFREASLRGQAETSASQLAAVTAQLDDLRDRIDQQVRTALLDVDAAGKLVQVSRSNVDLATRALSDETDRVSAGVDNNLPLVTAQATLSAAQTNYVENLYQYNLTKIGLARAAGVLEQQYNVYLGR